MAKTNSKSGSKGSNIKKVLAEALTEIKPTSQEEKAIFSKINTVIAKIKKLIPECKIILGGSAKKDTWLKDLHDADVFVQFPYKEYKNKSAEISEIVEKKLKKTFKLVRLHGSRDYFDIIIDGFTFEVVPIIEVKKANDALNITDISPLHSEWVGEHKKYADDVRLTKSFFKAAKAYGAESYINGFSGYICEILTIHFGGFEKLVNEIAKWKIKDEKDKIIIDTENYHKGKNALFEIDKAKTAGPLVVIDPVQASRNAAAALSCEKCEKIIQYSKDFLKSPSVDFFRQKKLTEADIKKIGGKEDTFLVEISALSGKNDIVGCVLLKCFNHIKQEIEENEFNLIHSDWEWNDTAKMYFAIKKEILPSTMEIKGPPADMKKAVENFAKVHKNTFTKEGFVFAKETREFTNAFDLIKSVSTDKYIKERIKNIKVCRI